MYIKKTWKAGKTVEVKKTYSARFGKKLARSENLLDTSKAAEKVNRDNAIANLRRILNENFRPGDWHAIFTYPQTVPPNEEEAREDRRRFLRLLKAVYAEQGAELRAVSVTEWTHKRIHHHIILPNLPDMKPVKALWKQLLSAKYYTDEERRNGEPLHLRFPWSPLDDSGQYGELAEYLVKETDKSRKLRGKYCRRYSCTKNIVRPQPKVEIISAAEWRDEPPQRKGYYIDRDASFSGISEYTGLPIQETIYVSLARAG